jgi:hypothetical protein
MYHKVAAALVLYEAYDALDKQYPKALGRYYDEFIRIRKETCRRFLGEIERDAL